MSEDAKAPVVAGDVLAGKYRVERVLGAGAMGVVVVATHTHLEQRVAIKFLLPEVLSNDQAVQRFAREAKAAARIRSEHVVRVLDVAKLEQGEPYMVMEYLEGRDLEAILRQEGPLPVDVAIDYVLQGLEALCEAHIAGVVHRDLKPSNMFLASRPDGSPIVKILDFGISKIASVEQAAMTQTQSILGSPLYMAPEQMRATKTVDRRADIWSMGVVLFQLLTARLPFVAETMPQLISIVMFEPPPLPSAVRPGLPPALDAVVAKCLEKVADKRFASVGELAAALAPFAPPRSRTSLERIERMTRALPGGTPLPTSAPGASAPGVSTGSAPVSASAAAPSALASTGAPQEGWQATQGGKGEGRKARAALLVGVAGAAVAVAVVTGIVMTRKSPAPAPVTGAVFETTIAAAPPPVAAIAPVATIAPIDTASASTSSDASAPAASTSAAAPLPSPAPRPAAATRGSAVAAPRPPPASSAASPNGGLSDFGGRH